MLTKLIVVTVLAAILELIDLGDTWQQIGPFWILIFYFILLIKYQIPVPLYIAIVIGLVIDIISGNILGQTSLCLVLISYITLINYKQIKFANITTRAVYFLIISYIYLAILLIPNFITGVLVFNSLILIAPITSTIFYILIGNTKKIL